MSAPYPAFRIDITYVFSGVVEKLDPQGTPVWSKQSLKPLQNLVVYTSDVGRDAAEGDLQPWCTDGKGLLRPLREGGAVHSFSRTRRFIVPPPSVILQAWVSNPKEAPELLAKAIAASEGSPGVELTKQRLDKSCLAPPDSKAENDPDAKAYADFYNKLAASAPLFAYVLPRSRAILLKFANPKLDGATVHTYRPDGTELQPKTVHLRGTALCAVHVGQEKDLPAGVYRFVVTPPRPRTGHWNSSLEAHDTYELKARLRFHITNGAGEFEIVDCDQITVQDAVLLQYATLYARLLAVAREERVPAASFDATFKQHPEVPLPEALKAWGERMAWMRGAPNCPSRRWTGS